MSGPRPRFDTIVRRNTGLFLMAVACLGASAWPAGKDAVTPKIVKRDGFTVVGIAVRTSNAKEMTAEGVIGKQWARMMQENLLARIPNKADANIVAVYTDYASDHNGEYTYILGARVSGTGAVPEGMVSKAIPAGQYAAFTTERGPAYKVVPDIWMKINSLPIAAPGGSRAYKADYEIYDERARDPQSSVVDVFVGVK